MLPILALIGLQQAVAMEEPGQLTVPLAGRPPIVCPLEGTQVVANVEGFGARVTVRQTFHNPTREAIEAIYTFPLPEDAAVDQMRLRVGERVVEGAIRLRDEARALYEAARNAGQTAALLDQERPNVFTQSVANIGPGARVEVEIGYVQVLKYEDARFEFVYPMVVGPRNVSQATDPGKIAPPTLRPGVRSGATIDLTLNVDAGAAIQDARAVLHDVDVSRGGKSRMVVRLKKKDEIPNRDFVFRYRVATDQVQSAFLPQWDVERKAGHFALVLLPPTDPAPAMVANRELWFVMDQSGSQQGFPIEKSKELTLGLVAKMRSDDTFNVMAFNTQATTLWPEPRHATEENVAEAQRFVQGLQANGGTNILEAVRQVLPENPSQDGIRIVVMNTDGYVGNETEILAAIRQRVASSRVFTFGIGNSVNRYLVDAMGHYGRGASEVVTLAEKADEAMARFYQRIESPVLTDVRMETEGPVSDVLPRAIPDVFSRTPIVIRGRYSKPGRASFTVSGRVGGQPWAQTMEVVLPGNSTRDSSIASLWARAKLDQLRFESAEPADPNRAAPRDYAAEMTRVALDYRIMSEFTSFVAVESRVVNVGGRQRSVRVPVEMADGVTMGMDVLERARDMSGGLALGGRPGSLAQGASANRGGLGGGGFGGATASPATSAGVQVRRADPRLSPVIGRATMAGKSVSPTTGQRAEVDAQKIAAGLRGKKGVLEVRVLLRQLDGTVRKAMKEAGFQLDDQDTRLKLVFGRIDAAKLAALARLEWVLRIEPLVD
ncbi:MAG: VWA domain-containing protein [Fimbriimonadaceae bacterium]|nr:VWA domain-containing protein [Fimbriimonadaceae bacterium]